MLWCFNHCLRSITVIKSTSLCTLAVIVTNDLCTYLICHHITIGVLMFSCVQHQHPEPNLIVSFFRVDVLTGILVYRGDYGKQSGMWSVTSVSGYSSDHLVHYSQEKNGYPGGHLVIVV